MPKRLLKIQMSLKPLRLLQFENTVLKQNQTTLYLRKERKKEKAQTNEYEYNTLFIWDCPNQLSLNPFHFYIYTITLTITALSPRILREWGVPRYKLHCKTGSYWAIVQKSEGVEYMKHVCNSISANHEPKVKIQHHLHIKHWKLSQYVTTLHFHR